MNHSFNIEIAKKIGIEKAILLENILFWWKKDKANNSNFHDNRYWIYNSSRAFAEIFPYMSQSSIKRHLRELVRDGYLLSGNYNRSAYDRTMWYSPCDSLISLVYGDTNDCQILDNGLSEGRPPIPIINTNIITDINHTISHSSDLESSTDVEDLKVEEYSIQEYVEDWNKIKELKQNGKVVKGLPKTNKVNEKITKARKNIRKEYNKDEIKTATNNYLDRIEKTIPSPKRDGTHRYTLYEFLTRENGLNKFINL